MTRPIETIIWDWNGTMLDDLELSLTTINSLLRERNLPEMDTRRYKESFGFPVKDYYERIGFDFLQEPFEIPAMQFIDRYAEGMYDCGLFPEVRPTLEYLKSKGLRQLVLSAMEKPRLVETLEHNQITEYFDHISGLDDHYANSKLDNGKRMLEELNLDPETTCMIGDTIHDYEVAEAMGIRSFLVAYGHQDEERLKDTGVEVLQNLQELIQLIS